MGPARFRCATLLNILLCCYLMVKIRAEFEVVPKFHEHYRNLFLPGFNSPPGRKHFASKSTAVYCLCWKRKTYATLVHGQKLSFSTMNLIFLSILRTYNRLGFMIF